MRDKETLVVGFLSGGRCPHLQKAGGDQDGDGGKLAATRNKDDCAVEICQAVIEIISDKIISE